MSKKQRIRPEFGERVQLKDYDPDYTGDFESKSDAKEALERNLERIDELQEVLYAEHKHALLLVFQAMDGGGKDSTIRYVMKVRESQGVQVASFMFPPPKSSTTISCGGSTSTCRAAA